MVNPEKQTSVTLKDLKIVLLWLGLLLKCILSRLKRFCVYLNDLINYQDGNMKFETSPTLNSDITIKNVYGKKIGVLAITYKQLSVEVATQLSELRAKLSEEEGVKLTVDRLDAMTAHLKDEALQYFSNWNLTDSKGKKMEINSENLDKIFTVSEYFWAIWVDFDAYTVGLSVGRNIKELNRKAELKNS